MADDPKIGTLRWPLRIAKRVQSTAGSASLTEALADVATVSGDVQSVGPVTYYQGQQTDRPTTHRIIIRWLDWLDETYVIVRDTLRRDDTMRTEVYRLRRFMEIGGRKRFLLIEAELETRF